MFIKFLLLASSLVAPSPSENVVKRGKILVVGDKITVLELSDNRQLKSSGVRPNDILISICETKIVSSESFRVGDGKLQVAESCEVKVKRGKSDITLEFVKGN